MALAKGQLRRDGRVYFTDADIHVWEEGTPQVGRSVGLDDQWEREFKHDVFSRIVQTLRRLGWEVTLPATSEHDLKDYGGRIARWAAERHRHCRKGDLFGELQIGGRHIEFKMWQSTNTPTRPDHGGKHEPDKESVMPYVLHLEMERTRRRIRDYLCNVFTGYRFDRPKPKLGLPGLTATDYAAHVRRSSGHYRPELDRAEFHMPCNCRGADGGIIEHGAKVWTLDHKGRVITGTAYYSLNDSWDIVTGRYGLERCEASRIFTSVPEKLRVKRNGRLRRLRLEKELGCAVKAMQFERAAVLRDVLFPGNTAIFNVWSNRHQLFHRANFCGYTPDQSQAGKFTAEEVREWNDGENRVMPITTVEKEAA